MWTMGDVLLNMYEELDACGLDKYGRPKNPVPTVPTRETENANPVNPVVVENKPVFPFITVSKHSDIDIKCKVNYNVTLTDAQFEKFLEVVKNLKR